MKTLLQIEMYYVRVELIIFKNLKLECILHNIGVISLIQISIIGNKFQG
jgi:hypothetical protein